MEKLIGLVTLLALSALAGCSDAEFTAEPLFTSSGFAGGSQAGASGEGEAGASGSAGEASALGSAGSAGTSAVGGSAGAAAGADAGTVTGQSGAAPVTEPPCTGAIDAPSHGYLALQKDTCYRTPDVFNTITCGGTGWAERTIKVNGAIATCDAMGIFPAPIAGYTYLEIDGGMPGADWLRWSESE